MDIEEVNQKITNKTLLRQQKPIYQIQRPNQSQPQFIIRKLLNRKMQKPAIGQIQRSPLFDKLAIVMPQLQKANQQLKNKDMPKIDIKLEKCQDSSQSSEDQQQPQNQQQIQIENQNKIEKQNNKKEISLCDNGQVEINILRYQMVQKKQQQTKPNKVMIQEIQ